MIEVKNLTKFYGDHKAVDNISFSVKDGTVCGFCGPNGAGKSTTMNIMTGCLSATDGTVTIGGHDIFEEPMEAKKLIGYLPEQPPLYLEETPREYLRFIAEAKKVPREKVKGEIERVMEETQILDVADRLIKNLSKGYKQRVGIAQTLLGNPKVIILDEPTVGLDPIQVVEIRDLIKNLGKRHTVILSSHILSEVQQMCDEIIIIAKGKLIAYDTAENLEKLLQPKVTLEVLTDATREESGAVLGQIAGIESAQYAQEDGLLLIRLTTVPEKELEIRKLLSRKFAAIDRAVLRNDKLKANLEEIFIELTSPQPDGPEENREEEA
ncbi:ABC transporter ATP-binding protein [Mordavella massiliensis]|uniref:ABC transporter ATP-binding protein n=1 Tax=Mordavella massiliensis TaxID=1871024 RepID=A0A939BFF9_9CLOT|nr:ABC transporter ATP-binding protein [Mordavella massiliensis]MBM6948217.1 ABC transporter ATP-binding protein [Mordavella massiliensis]